MFRLFNNGPTVEDSLRQQCGELAQRIVDAGHTILGYRHEIRLLNRAIRRRNKVNREQRAKITALTNAAITLRKAQRAYMANRSNDAFGCEVARAAQALDDELPPYTPGDKALAALANSRTVPRATVDTPPVGCPSLD